jgi:hypothetical protein
MFYLIVASYNSRDHEFNKRLIGHIAHLSNHGQC